MTLYLWFYEQFVQLDNWTPSSPLLYCIRMILQKGQPAHLPENNVSYLQRVDFQILLQIRMPARASQCDSFQHRPSNHTSFGSVAY